MGQRRRYHSKSADEPKSPSRLLLWGVCILTLITLIFLFQFSSSTNPWKNSFSFLLGKSHSKPASPQPALYNKLKLQLNQQQQALAKRYLSAGSPEQKDAILNDASELLNKALPELMRCWLGTPWAYHGTSTVPGEGEIACGYFVSTILRDAGFQVERVKLAQQASQNIIATFLPRSDMDIQVGMDYSSYVERILARPFGIHIVGLDNHVAFVITTSKDFRFIHSSGVAPMGVVDQNQHQAAALRTSRYRVIGNLTQNNDILRKWLLNEPFPTQT